MADDKSNPKMKKNNTAYVVCAGYTVNTGSAVYGPGDVVEGLAAGEVKRLVKAAVIEARG